MAEPRWIPITEQLPPIHQEVQFTCWIEDHFTDTACGWFCGAKTWGHAIVMERCWNQECGNWLPCSHWMPLAAPPEQPDAE